MSQYIFIIIWLAIAAGAVAYLRPYREESVYGLTIKKYHLIAALVIILPLILFAGFRPSGVFDTGQYARSYQGYPSTFREAFLSWNDWPKDKAFYVFASLIHAAFGDDTRIYFTIIAAIQGLLLARLFRNYSTDYLFSVFVFVATTDYLSWMHNGIRQFMAVTIILAGTSLFLEKKYLWSILVILFASLFHASALLMIPIIFVTMGKPWNVRTIILLAVTIVAVIFIDRFTGILEYLLEDTQYKNVVDDWVSWEDNGTNPLRVLVYSVPMIISVIGFKYVRSEDSLLINIAVNMSIVASALYIVSMFTSGIFVGRLPIYASIYSNCILLPWEIDKIFDEESAKVIKLIAVAGYLIFYYYQCHVIWGLF